MNFFIDRNVFPIEITIEHEMNHSELLKFFESIKSKIGPASNYGLSKQERDEIARLKQEIAKRETSEIERKKAGEDLERKEKDIAEMVRSLIMLKLNFTINYFLIQTKALMEQKRQEIIEMEKQSLPVRHYLFKYVLPNITEGLVECAKQRPKKPVEFLAKFMLNQGKEKIDEDLDLDQEVVDEFKKLIESKCDE